MAITHSGHTKWDDLTQDLFTTQDSKRGRQQQPARRTSILCTVSLVVFPAVSNLEYAGCFLFSLSFKPTRVLGVHVTFSQTTFPSGFLSVWKMGGTKTRPEQLEARGGRDTTCFPASMASGEERNSQLSLAFPAPAEPHDPHSSGPKCQHQPFRAPRLLVSHFPFCSPNPGLKGNNYLFLNMLGVFFFFQSCPFTF